MFTELPFPADIQLNSRRHFVTDHDIPGRGHFCEGLFFFKHGGHGRNPDTLFLVGLNQSQPLKMTVIIEAPTPPAGRRVNQAFLNIITYCSSWITSDLSKIVNCVFMPVHGYIMTTYCHNVKGYLLLICWIIEVSKGTRRPPGEWPSRPLHFSPVPPASPGGGIPDRPPLKGKGPCQPRTGLSCPLLRYAWVAPSPDGSVTPPAICLSTSPGALCPRLSIRSPRSDRIAHLDHPLSFPLKGDPPPAL